MTKIFNPSHKLAKTEGQEYPNLSVISNMPSTSTSQKTVGSKRLMKNFDSQDDVHIDFSEQSLEQIIKYEFSQYK